MLHDFSWIDLTEPDPKHNGAAMRNERLAPIWKEQGNEMTGLFGRGCLTKLKRSELPMGTRSSPPVSTIQSSVPLRESTK